MLSGEELQAFLAWSALPHAGEQTIRAVLDHARDGRQGLAALWRTRVDDLAAHVRFHPRTRAVLEGSREHQWEQAGADRDQVLSWGVEVLLPQDAEFPARLLSGERAWPFLFVYGGLHVLETPGLVLLNSRQVTPGGIAVTDAIADAWGRRDGLILTSPSRDVYRAAATAAKRQAALTALVPDRGFAAAFPEGLEREPVDTARIWDSRFDPELQMLLSPFAWREPWKHSGGARRDALLCDLAAVLVAVEVRVGGVMDRECRAAAAQGRPVFALDRGAETPEGTRVLWETAPGVQRLRWQGGDAAAAAIASVPASGMGAGVSSRAGWDTEVARFMARAAGTLQGSIRPGAWLTWPARGPLAVVARGAGAAEAAAGAAADCVLADVTQDERESPARVDRLLARIAPSGVAAVLAPAEWLEATRYALARDRWLTAAVLRVVVGLPQPVGTAEALRTAILFLQRRPAPPGSPALFSPRTMHMGRFQLRRYLQEVRLGLP